MHPDASPFDDNLYQRRYDRQRYNCFHFACDCLAALGKPVSYESVFEGVQRASQGTRREFVRTTEPVDGTLCLCRNFPDDLHCGVFYKGKVLHLREAGLSWQPLHLMRLHYRRIWLYNYSGPDAAGPVAAGPAALPG